MPGVKLATAYYELIPSMAGNQAAISTQMGAAGTASSKSFASSFKGGLSSNMKAIGIAGAAAAAVGFVKGSVAEAREAQKVGALTAQIIKTTGGAANVTAKSVGDLSTAISKKTGIDDEAIQTGANVLLAFKNIRNEAGAGNKVFDEATKAATDLSATPAFNGNLTGASKALGKALADPVKGLGGLSKAGIKFTETQKKQIAAMVKGGDVLGAQKVILNEIKGRVGGAAAAQATAGEKMSRSWDAFKESAGTKLLPVLDKLWAGLAKVLNFISSHQSVMVTLAAIVGVILVAALVAAAAAAWTFTIALLANPIVWIIIAIIALVAAIVLLVKHWDVVKAKMIQVWNAIKAKTAAAWDAIKAKFADAWDAIKRGVTSVKTWISDKWTAIINFFRGLPSKITNAVKGMWDGIKSAFRSAINWVISKWNGLEFGIPAFNFHGKHFGGFSVGTPNIPLLGAGGIVTRPTLAMIGESGSEAVVPLSRLSDFAAGGQRQFTLRSGALELVNGKAYISGVLEEHAFEMGMATG